MEVFCGAKNRNNCFCYVMSVAAKVSLNRRLDKQMQKTSFRRVVL